MNASPAPVVSTTDDFCSFTAGAKITSTAPSAAAASSPASVNTTASETTGHAGTGTPLEPAGIPTAASFSSFDTTSARDSALEDAFPARAGARTRQTAPRDPRVVTIALAAGSLEAIATIAASKPRASGFESCG